MLKSRVEGLVFSFWGLRLKVELFRLEDLRASSRFLIGKPFSRASCANVSF